ncbi:MAG: amidoligase family protein [Mailhella sp.]|nr:amidoligase family protein [Mailhella sp.]
MERSFGIELEIAGITQRIAKLALSAVGVQVQAESYNHSTRAHWKIVSDASVRGGFEVVSPILHGEQGIIEAMKVATALDDAGASINRTCGFHVHFDASDLDVETIKTIVRRYAEFESEVDAVMPPSRRGDANNYCHSMAGVVTPSFLRASTIRELATVQGSRYYKVNLQSFQRHGTIEFRQHSGTVNANKISNWVRFLGEFIDVCKAESGSSALPVIEHPALRGVQRRLADMFTAQGSVQLSEICEAFGWQPHTARAAVTRLRQAGLEIESVRGRAMYRLVSGMVQQPSASRCSSIWHGISESVVTFYRNRAAVLAAAM